MFAYQLSAADASEAFQKAIAAAGLSPPISIVADGKIHRFASDGSRRDDAGWYVAHFDDVPSGAFGCWRLGFSQKWCARSRSELSTAEKSELRRRIADEWKLRDEADAVVKAEARKRSVEIWDNRPAADPQHDYLVKKKVRPHDSRQDGDRLVVPVRDIDGTMHGLQYITADGDKEFLFDTAKKGHFHLIGQLGDVVVIAEGYATGASVHEVTGYSVAIAFDAGNLEPVAESIREKWPDCSIIIAGDNDKSGVGQEKARVAAAASGGKVVIPERPSDWPDDRNSYDWNDAHVREGSDAVKKAFGLAVARAPVEKPGDEAVLKRLTALSSVEYERVRKVEAGKLGVRVTILDAEVAKHRHTEPEEPSGGGFNLPDPEAWPDAVDGAELLDSLTETIKRHVILPAWAAEAVALWIVHTHAYHTADITPILGITSPVPECGKTTLIALLDALTRRPLTASNISAAAVYRTIDKWRPTLLTDEVDTYLPNNEQLRGVLNSGHSRSTAYVIRADGDNYEPRRYSTWAPKAIALIGKLPNTLESRSVHIELQRMGHGEYVERLRSNRLKDFEPLRQQCSRWARDNEHELKSADPVMPTTMHGRAADNWRHLVAIADLARGEWPRKARAAAEMLSDGHDGKTAGIQLLEDIRTIFQEKKTDKLPSAEIAAALGTMEDKPWQEWSKGKPITPNAIARLLKPFHIVPGTIRTATTTPKGYYLDAFDDAFRRYLPLQTATTPQPLENKASSDFQTATNDAFVAVGETLEPLRHKGCGVVAVQEAVADGQVIVMDDSTVPTDPLEFNAGGGSGGPCAKLSTQSEPEISDNHPEAFDDAFVAAEKPEIWEGEI